jgi:hypothetical protein
VKAADKWSWLLRQKPGTMAEQCLLQALVIACHPKPTRIDGGWWREDGEHRVHEAIAPPFHAWLSSGEITQRTGMNERTVPAVVERLCQRGLVKQAGWYGRTGQIKVFRLLIDGTETRQKPAAFSRDQTPLFPAPLAGDQTPQVPAPFEAASLASNTVGSCIERPQVSTSPYIGVKRELKRERDIAREKTVDKKVRKAMTPRHQIPDDWTPDAKQAAWAAKQLPGVELDPIVRAFRAYHSGTGEARPGWARSFVTWITKEVGHQAKRPQRRGPSRDLSQMNYEAEPGS